MAIEVGDRNLVNALLNVGAQPTIELAMHAQELGYLKIMHRLLFATLAKLREVQKYPQLNDLATLFK